MVQPSEVVTLLVALVLAPMIVTSVIRIRMAHGALVLAALGALLVSYIATIVEGLLLPDLFNALEHFSLAAAGLMFILLMVRLRCDERGRHFRDER